MAVNSTVRVPTAHASRYLQQLCKHWSHTLAVTFSETAGTVTFPRTARGRRDGRRRLASRRPQGMSPILLKETPTRLPPPITW
jgi:hypothetical protein